MNLWSGLFEHYKAYHAYGPPRLKYMGYLGAISFTLFYFLRFTRPNVQLYDDLALRSVVVVLFVFLALRDYWPERLKPYYFGYSYVTLLYGLPCFTVITALQRGGGVPAMSNTFIILCFLVLLTDWRNTLVMLAAGISAGLAFYFLTSPNPKIPMDLVAQFPAYALIIIGGNLFKFSTEQIDTERKLRATQALAGSIAHEMRHPLAQLKHSLENMQQALPSPASTTQPQAFGAGQVDALYRHLAQSEIAVKRGLQVIAMTLDEVSEKPMRTAAFSYLSAAEATNKAVQEYGYENKADRGKVNVHVIEDFSFRGDETAYLFVLFNLIKNALYYMALRPEARMTITIERQQVKVRDTGPGIRPEVLARLFEPFRSVGKSGGTGLGLAYCQRVMRAFDGQIRCESVLGEYTQFIMRFPPISEQESQAHRLAVLDRARTVFSGKRLLIVDDDSTQRMTTRHKLQPLGAAIDEAADGQRALDMLGKRHYDLVLLDLNMPVLDGYAVAERLRQGQVPANRDVRIVAYTSEPAHLAGVKTEKAGMDGFVSKPSAQMPLIQALHQALEHSISRAARPQADLLLGRRVMLADDNPYNRRAVAAYLKHAGATVVEAGHGQAVLDQLQEPGAWHAILMDINMPGMTGVETTQAIRASGAAWCNVPIIALTAHSDEETMRAATAAGMNDFITKPVEAATLYKKLGQLVGNAELPMPAHGPGVGLEASDESGAQLLNRERLESYRTIGMLEELLNDYVPEIGRLVERLDQQVAAQALQETLDTLHSLLGMSGEAGASALYQLVRQIYVPMVEEHSWPASNEGLGQIKVLAARTERALRAYGSARPTAKAG
jgi:two-component system CAI-1 autoinducer sensor kinase/phosphatase CqsS